MSGYVIQTLEGCLKEYEECPSMCSCIYKEDIDSQCGGFYVTNGILNYKKPVKKSNYQVINKYNENQKRFNKLYLRPLIKALIESRVPQCIGKYLLMKGEKTIYIDFYPGAGYYGNIWNKRQI